MHLLVDAVRPLARRGCRGPHLLRDHAAERDLDPPAVPVEALKLRGREEDTFDERPGAYAVQWGTNDNPV